MKELSIEEKATRYEQAIKVAQRFYNNSVAVTKKGLEDIFPELKESKDERICKALIDYFKWNPNGQLLNEFSNREVFAWLEKQKAIDILDEEEREFVDNVDSYRKEVDAAYQKGYDEGVKVTLEKQGEQKPNDEIGNYDHGKVLESLMSAEMKTPEESLGIDSETYSEIVDECIYGEQKPAWSEEDEKKINYLIALLQDGTIHNPALRTVNEELENWFKSLKDRVYPQNKWKPSDEQMMYLSEAIDVVTRAEKFSIATALKELREQLKKLSEE